MNANLMSALYADSLSRRLAPPLCVEAVVDDHAFVRILAISGSLRRASTNSALVEAAGRLAPAAVKVSTYRELAGLPPFNPDDAPPETVLRFQAQLEGCDAVLISSPEYAHGVPGVMKNALDWVVGSGELMDKPVALINASPRATHAWESLRETLTVMSALVVAEASITVPLAGKAVDAGWIVADVEASAALRSAIVALARAVHEKPPPTLNVFPR